MYITRNEGSKGSVPDWRKELHKVIDSTPKMTRSTETEISAFCKVLYLYFTAAAFPGRGYPLQGWVYTSMTSCFINHLDSPAERTRLCLLRAIFLLQSNEICVRGDFTRLNQISNFNYTQSVKKFSNFAMATSALMK